jgi:glycolate oxidase FAD binding subunit
MPKTQPNIAAQLAAITGAEHVRSSEDIITVSPANTKQVSEILRYANENNLTVTPIGGSTKQSWGNEIQPYPTKTNIRLELTRLNRVIEHPWQDLTCTVQAGCTWQQLQQHPRHQRLRRAPPPLRQPPRPRHRHDSRPG